MPRTHLARRINGATTLLDSEELIAEIIQKGAHQHSNCLWGIRYCLPALARILHRSAAVRRVKVGLYRTDRKHRLLWPHIQRCPNPNRLLYPLPQLRLDRPFVCCGCEQQAFPAYEHQ